MLYNFSTCGVNFLVEHSVEMMMEEDKDAEEVEGSDKVKNITNKNYRMPLQWFSLQNFPSNTLNSQVVL